MALSSISALLFLDNSTGKMLSGVTINYTEDWFDTAFDLVADNQNGNFAVGWLVNQGTGADPWWFEYVDSCEEHQRFSRNELRLRIDF